MQIDLEILEEHDPSQGWADLAERFHPIALMEIGDLEAPPVGLTLVFTGDLVQSVRTHSPNETDFTPERLGGQVAAKTIALQRDYSNVVIVVGADAGEPTDELSAYFGTFWMISLLAHEYGHVFLGRLRAAAGTRPAPPTEVQTLLEAGAIVAYEAADEFRCDMFANNVLSHIRVGVNGEPPKSLRLTDLRGTGYSEQLAQVLDSVVFPGWPDLVESYRRWEIPLEGMLERLGKEMHQTLKLIAHAEATAQSAGLPPQLGGLADNPGVRGYLGPVWNPIRTILDQSPIMPDLPNFADIDRSLQDCGRHFEAVWRRLGITNTLVDGGLYFDVSDPVR